MCALCAELLHALKMKFCDLDLQWISLIILFSFAFVADGAIAWVLLFAFDFVADRSFCL